jgi:hypothetical protein
MCEEIGGTVDAVAEHRWWVLLIINALAAILFSLSASSSSSEGQGCTHRREDESAAPKYHRKCSTAKSEFTVTTCFSPVMSLTSCTPPSSKGENHT